MAIIAQSDLENRVGVAEVSRYSRSNPALITAAIAQAVDRARSAALNVFTPDSWDAMTSSTLPPEAQFHLVSDAVDILSSGLGRPEDITTKAAEAKQWRSFLAADTVRCFDAVLTRSTAQIPGRAVRTAGPAELSFDTTDDMSLISLRDRPL